MKQIKNYTNMIAALLLLIACYSCKDKVSFDPEIDVPEGIYVLGEGTKFSVPASKGRLEVLKNDTLFHINTWLQNEGTINIALVGSDGMPVHYGQGEALSNDNPEVLSYKMSTSGSGFNIPREGLYQVIVNTLLQEVHLVPYSMQIVGDLSMTEDGEQEVPFEYVRYDNTEHIVTWQTGLESQILLPSEFWLTYAGADSFTIPLDNTEAYEIASRFTGPGGNPRTNILTEEYTNLNRNSDVALNLVTMGDYIVTMQYHVLTNTFSAKIGGEEIIEGEPEGYTETLYMSGDAFGNGDWTADGVVQMTPVGAAGNGSFWTIKYFTAGQTVRWSPEQSSTGSFASLGNDLNFEVVGDGATVQTSGLYLVYIDMHRGLIAFETPQVFGIGDTFNGNEVPFNLADDTFEATTTSTGALRMFATSSYNNRDWMSMEFNIYNGQIVYRGVEEQAQETVPLAAGIDLELDFSNEQGEIKSPLDGSAVPTSASAIYMIGDEFGNMNWGSSAVEMFARNVNGAEADYRWIYFNYFTAGTGIRFSTDPQFGAAGEFVELDNNEGFTVENGKAMISESGVYGIYVDLASRSVYIQRATIYGYDAAAGTWGDTNAAFDENPDGTVSFTFVDDGRFRIHPFIPGFLEADNPTFGSWKREMALDPETLDIYYREPGSPEPNQNYDWTAGQTITLDFRTMKGTIE